MNSQLFEANREKDDFKNQMNELMKVIGTLKEQNHFLTTELKETKIQLKRQAKDFFNQMNDGSSDEGLDISCNTDYDLDKDSKNKLFIPRGDERISNMAMTLASLMRQISS